VPKCAKHIGPSQIKRDGFFFSLVINNLSVLIARGQTGKGANRILFFGAGNGLAQLAKNRLRLSFPASFSLVHFFWRSKRNEHKPDK
jgi:hypothetical protein